MHVKSQSRGSSPSRAFGALPLLSPCSGALKRREGKRPLNSKNPAHSETKKRKLSARKPLPTPPVQSQFASRHDPSRSAATRASRRLRRRVRRSDRPGGPRCAALLLPCIQTPPRSRPRRPDERAARELARRWRTPQTHRGCPHKDQGFSHDCPPGAVRAFEDGHLKVGANRSGPSIARKHREICVGQPCDRTARTCGRACTHAGPGVLPSWPFGPPRRGCLPRSRRRN